MLPLLLSLGIAALYLGFAGVLGALLALAMKPAHRLLYATLAAVHGALLLVPATIFVLGTADWPQWVRIILVLLAGAVAFITATRPSWTPEHVWHPSFKHQYFAGTMILTAAWGLGLGLAHTSAVTVLMGAAASVAGSASLYAGLRRG